MPLTLELTTRPEVPLEIEGLTPRTAAELSPAELANFEIHHGNRKQQLGEFFELSGSAEDLDLRFLGDLSGVHWIGAGMDAGQILIEGNAGRHVGSEMTAGRIEVRGNVSDWVGAELHGGEIFVSGDAGHLVGAGYRGSRRGMTGGRIIVCGKAGNEIGHTMRRGTIAVGGNSGDLPGFNMIAGSIYLFGDCGIRPGAAMKRGTIAYFGAQHPEMLPTFRRAGTDQPDFMRVAWRSLQRAGLEIEGDLSTARFALYHGDFLDLGRGEIWLRES